MTELENLQAELRKSTPAPHPQAKAHALRLAAENFARLQETGNATRPTSDTAAKRPIWKGLFAMFTRQTLRPALYTTSCLIVAGAVFTAYQPLRDTLPSFSGQG